MAANTSKCALVINQSLVVLGKLRVDHDKQKVCKFGLLFLLPNYLLYLAQDVPPTVCT